MYCFPFCILQEQDCKVTSISRRGTPPDWAAGEEWTDTVTWKAGDCYDADATIKLMRGNSVVVSCLGVIGFDNDALESGNGDLNVAALTTAKKAGINKAVYVSVASLVEEAFGDKLLTGYFKGKRTANALVSDLFKNNGKIVKPSFIYGGDKFELSPPRVPYGYGGFISKLLSAGPIQAIAEKSPAPLAVVLAPPVNVDDVAKSVVGLALGKVSGTNVDGTTEIEEAAAAI
jgi:hypothetical protein